MDLVDVPLLPLEVGWARLNPLIALGETVLAKVILIRMIGNDQLRTRPLTDPTGARRLLRWWVDNQLIPSVSDTLLHGLCRMVYEGSNLREQQLGRGLKISHFDI